MLKLTMNSAQDPVTSDTLLVLQFHTVNDPWFPRLKTFECVEATEAFTPFIPLFLSPKTAEIDIRFTESTPTLVIGSTIKRLSPLCPNLESITFHYLPRDPAITEAVSEMLLACKRDTLQKFRVDSPLTEEAREVVYRLPRLSELWTVIQGSTSLPKVALPNLISIDVEYDGDLTWMQGFYGAKLGKLITATFHSEPEQVGDFLEAFKSVALAASAQNVLPTSHPYTLRSWNPNYSSLLPFNRLKDVIIEFSCEGGCSSRIDDDIIISMARAMPKLEMLRLGKAPCATSTGVTVNGLIGLARLCPHLSKLRIHFQAATLVEAATSAATLPDLSDGELIRQEDCALTDLEVGRIPIPAQPELLIALVLLQIFPRIRNIGYVSLEWRSIAGTIRNFRQIKAFVHRTGKACPSYT